MRYILIILVFLSVGANAQMVIKAHANYRPYAQPAANLLLDDYPNAAAAYSLRKLDKDYTGSCIRIRRDSTGQAETDIGFDASGVVDTNAIKSFLRNNSGRVVRWYDQSGNGRDKTNATQSRQPEIAFLGDIKRTNGKPCINFQDLNVLISSSSYVITHTVQVAKVIQQATINYLYGLSNSGFYWNGSFSNVNGLGVYDGTNFRGITGEDLNQHIGFFSIRSSKIFITRDNGTETDAGSFGASFTVDRIGGRIDVAGLSFRGEVQEVISWNSDQSSNRAGIMTNINTYYAIY